VAGVVQDQRTHETLRITDAVILFSVLFVLVNYRDAYAEQYADRCREQKQIFDCEMNLPH